jgi:hypothetical protein
MSVLTMPAQPGQGTDPELRPVQWRGMLWVTWRQHRGLLISVATAFIVGVIGMLVEGLRIHHDYAMMVACRPAASPACQQLSHFFESTDWHQAQDIHVAVLGAPALLTLFAGPPVLARELENSTYRYAWTQGIGRVRWTVAKLIFIGSVVTIAAFVIGELFGWFFAPFLTTLNTPLHSVGVFDTRGVAYAAWTLTGFCVGAFLGMLLRRVIPAMAATLGVYLALATATLVYLRSHYPHYPVSTFWPVQLLQAGWLLVLSALLFTGTVWLVRRDAA